MSWLTTTSARANTASVSARSPVSQSKQWLSVLPARSSRITGADGSSAVRTSTTAGRCSYSTSISSSASRAAYRSSATTNATSWPWKRTLSVARTACSSLARVGIQARFRSASMAPVTTSRTFGWACAAVTSTLRIRPCAIGDRRIARCSVPGNWRSSMKSPLPRRNRGSSLRSIRPWPTGRRSFSTKRVGSGTGISTAYVARRPGAEAGTRLLGRGPLHGAHDGGVSGAAADLPGDRLADLRLARLGLAIQQGPGRHQHARRAESTLESVALHETALDGVELAVLLQSLDRAHVVPGGRRREHRARLDRLAVEPDRASAAVARVAAPVRAGQSQVVPQEMHQQQPGLDLTGHLDAVDGHDDVHRYRSPRPGATTARA